MIRCSEMLLKSGLDRNGPARHTAPVEACLCRGDAGRSREGTSGRRREGDSHEEREGDSHHLDHLGSHHLGAVSGAFPVNNRGRWWFIWRSLHPGRRVRRPYTDLSTLVGPTARRGQSSFRQSFRQSPFRRGVRGIPSQQSGSTVVHLEVFTSRATHASPLHGFIDPTAPGMHPSAPVSFLRRGDSGEGDSHHLDQESCGGGREGDSHHLRRS